ncbi:tripartite tricarboxylate transporter substrate binding protein [Caballeronia sp. GAFFF2]|uniref:Bug family tripartite tricarboxylate transporter substrate binding protein n=1 Tax=Caballeronia sp. GAFFF2 TaxID=2921741 RepID=UPI00202970CF|nr:tripartite tricarboxylate transporter substrate binding protein [Caballeronia sp. GAFFF2]
MNRRSFLGAAGGLTAAAMTGQAFAEDAAYPSRPVSLIVGAPPGGGNDIVARLLAERLTADLKSPFLVDNRPGASGARAAEYVTRLPRDGYALLMANVATHAINPILLPDSSFDPKRDSVPISMLGKITNILVINPKLPVNSVAELIAYAKAHPGKLNFGSAGTGGSVHLAGELFKLRTGVDIVHVPYRGSGPMVTDLMSGVCQLAFDNYPSSIGGVRAGSMRALAVTAADRWPLVPDLPTMQEAGVPNFDITTWFGITARSGTPDPVVSKLHGAIEQILKSPDFIKHLAAIGAVPFELSRSHFANFLTEEHNRWKEIVDGAHVKIA